MNVELLVAAIATCARNEGGFLTKTKLLKLLYLLDVEFYRRYSDKLTPFEYIFYKYGPWDAAYETLVGELNKKGVISLSPGSRRDLDTKFINPGRPISADQVFHDSEKLWLFRQVIRPWLDSPTSRILDYVYFYTEPMIDALKGERLDFGKIDKSIVRYVRSARPEASEDRIREMRKRIAAATRKGPRKELHLIPEPRFDEVYWDSMATAASDE